MPTSAIFRMRQRIRRMPKRIGDQLRVILMASVELGLIRHDGDMDEKQWAKVSQMLGDLPQAVTEVIKPQVGGFAKKTKDARLFR